MTSGVSVYHGVMLRLVAATAMILAAIGAWAEAFVIKAFDVTMQIEPNGKLHVEERILVEFTESRRGIIRKIPFRYETGRGIGRRVEIRVGDVDTEGGASDRTDIATEGAYLRIRIGDPNVWLEAGRVVTYVIRYTAIGAVNWFEKTDWGDYAEVYWNATGDEWEVPIERASVRVRFPAVGDSERVRARVFVGPLGSTLQQTIPAGSSDLGSDQTRTVSSLSSSELLIRRDAPLAAHEGMTFVLNVPADSIVPPGPAEQLLGAVRENLGFGLPLVTLIGMGGLFLRYGRDAKPKPLTVQFEPPDGVTAPEAGTILDERVDQRDLAAGIIGLAVKGYLTIHPEEEGIVFKRRTATLRLTGKTDDSPLSPFEQFLIRLLRQCGPVIGESDLREHVAPHASDLRSMLYAELVDRGYYLRSPETVRAIWIGGGIAVIALLGVICVFLSPFRYPMPSIVGGLIAAILIVGFGLQMPKRTVIGARALDKVRGFEEFIRRARSDELEWMSKKEPTAALFEEYLPYAVAFGLTAEWAQAFEGIVKEMPSWYDTPGGRGFSARWFATDLMAISNTVASAAVTMPRSSGGSGGFSGFSSGGGFSGGGFGGGGGSSW
jgi:uncharacterized membrane protein YgcG